MFSALGLKGWHFLRVILVPALLLLGIGPAAGEAVQAPANIEFRVSLSAEAMQGIADLGLETPVNGRLFVIVSQDDSSEPREQIDVTGVPFWGKDVFSYGPGRWVSLDDRDSEVIGFPLEKMADLPAGDYLVQAFLDVYTTFQRADGNTVLMHQDAGDGQYFWESPGNAYSTVQNLHLEPKTGQKVELTLSQVLQPDQPLQPGQTLQQGNYVDTDMLKYVKIQSQVVSQFWGQPMYIGANVLLPMGYADNPDTYYPVIYLQGHFPGGSAPFGYRECNAFCQFWKSDSAPRFIAVTFRDANPYYDTSYSVNSANVGPYGDAIMNELIPYLESNFRILAEPSARLLAGGSTGGWEALAMKVWNPDFFTGTWSWCPDSVDFHYHQIVNVYADENAYEIRYDWNSVERPSSRRRDGNINFTIGQENHWERAMGVNSRSGGQWDIWEAVYSPLGADGYPAHIWDKASGEIDHSVAQYWLDNYDIVEKLRREWPTLGPKLAGQLTVTTGMMDTYYLNESTYLLKAFLESATNPTSDAKFDLGFRQPHCWRGESPNNPGQIMSYQEFIQIAWDWYMANKP